jgi:hypothetical protein
MAQQLWSFIRNFSNTKFYDAAQQGSMNGAAPFTIGAIFATVETGDGGSTGGALFQNTNAVGVTGFGLHADGDAANGTVDNGSPGPNTSATGVVLPTATDLTSAENLANAAASALTASITWGTSRGSNRPRSVQLVHLTLTVPAAGDQIVYINGHVVQARAVGLATNPANVTIGNRPDHAFPTAAWLAGVYYKAGTVYTSAEIAAMHAACAQAKDLVGPSRYRTASVDPSYMWSVKRGNFDLRANWASDGSAATPITMVRSGAWNPVTVPGSIDGDVFAADVPWMQI